MNSAPPGTTKISGFMREAGVFSPGAPKRPGWRRRFSSCVLALFLSGSVSLSLATPHVFPVPYVEGRPNHTAIFFKDLPGAGTIKIFTITGELVIQLPIAPGQNLLSWNVRNASGGRVASGVYLFRIESGGGKTTGKLVVVK